MKLPFEFNLKLVFRMLLPGVFFALGLLPIVQTILDKLSAPRYTEAVFVALAILGGWLVVVLDMHIYMFYEGRRYWPTPVKNFFVRQEQIRVANLNKIIERYRSGGGDYLKYLEANVELRQYPVDNDWKPYAIYPTRLGNILKGFETYPEVIYGMPAPFYWPRIWLALDKEQREEIDNLQALADSTLYTSLMLYVCGLLCFLYALMESLRLDWISYLPSALILWLLCFLAFLAGWLIYRGSFHLHVQFGELFKAVFDVNHEEVFLTNVLEQLKDYGSIGALDNAISKQQYWEIWRFLQYYRIKLPDGKVVSPAEALTLRRKSKEG